jgi:hypothetical protein
MENVAKLHYESIKMWYSVKTNSRAKYSENNNIPAAQHKKGAKMLLF